MPLCSGAGRLLMNICRHVWSLIPLTNANATSQSQQKKQCGVGSRAQVYKPAGPILPGVCRVTVGKSRQRCALLVPPVIKSLAPQSRGCLCTALNNEVLILFEVPWHSINTIILIILYDLLPHHQDSF